MNANYIFIVNFSTAVHIHFKFVTHVYGKLQIILKLDFHQNTESDLTNQKCQTIYISHFLFLCSLNLCVCSETVPKLNTNTFHYTAISD